MPDDLLEGSGVPAEAETTPVGEAPGTPVPAPSEEDALNQYIDQIAEESKASEEATVETEETSTVETPATDVQGHKPGVATNKAEEPAKPTAQDTSAAQDLVDAFGNVIARSGMQRRLYQERSLHRAIELEGVTKQQATQLQEANAKIAQAEQMNNHVQQAGLTPTEMAVGVELVKGLKADPVATMNKVLTDLQAKGYNVGTPESGGTLGLTPDAIKQMIKEEISPLVQDRNTQNAQTERDAQINHEVTQFYSLHPDARLHNDLLAQVLDRNPSWSLETAYWYSRDLFSQKGVDWSKPLADQLVQPASSNTVEAVPTVPVGTSGNGITQLAAVPQAGADDSWDNIISRSIKTGGIQ